MVKNTSSGLDILGAVYSADPKLTLTDLKKGAYDESVKLDNLVKYADQQQICSVHQHQSHYPQKLKKYSSAPFLFYYQGDLSLLDRDLLGIVGPRNPSEYADQVMQSFFLQAYHYNLAVVSGFARGVDQLAHTLSLKYQIPTIAILGGGFKHYLKSKDRELLRQIVEQGGLVLSQFKLDFEPTKWSFPARNKFLAQIVDVLFLPEAQQKSGSLITTDFAYEYQKPIYSVPAPLFSQQSAGIFSKMEEKKLTLISDFSSCLQKHFSLDVDLQEGSFDQNSASKIPSQLTDLQQQIYLYLQSSKESSVEQLLESLQLEYAVLMQELTILEMEGLLVQIRPGYYALQ